MARAARQPPSVTKVEYEFYESDVSVVGSPITRDDVLVAAARAFPRYIKQMTVKEVGSSERKKVFTVSVALETLSTYFVNSNEFGKMCQTSMDALLKDIRAYSKIKIGDAHLALEVE
jgi:hypothetical protein